MKLHELSHTKGARRDNFRKGRGIGSGNGKTSGKGHKGQNARSGGGVRPGFEGGQTPLYRRIPKRGFTNIFRTEFAAVNLETLNERFKDGDTVTMAHLIEAKIVKQAPNGGVKILGNGKLEKKLTVKANKFSASAAKAIEAAGGTAEVVKK